MKRLRDLRASLYVECIVAADEKETANVRRGIGGVVVIDVRPAGACWQSAGARLTNYQAVASPVEALMGFLRNWLADICFTMNSRTEGYGAEYKIQKPLFN